MADLGDISVSMGLDTSEFDRELRKIQKELAGLGKGFDGVSEETVKMAKRMASAYAEHRQKMRAFNLEQLAVQSQFLDLALASKEYQGTTKEFMNELDALGKKHKEITDNMLKNNELAKTGFLQSIATINAKSSQAEKISKNYDRMNNPLLKVNGNMLKVANSLDVVARRAQPAGMALKLLGPNANMKELQDMTMMISQGMMRFQSVALIAVAGAGLFYSSLHKSAMENDTYKKSFTQMTDAIKKMFKPLVDVFAQVMPKIYNVITAIAKWVTSMENAHPMITKIVAGVMLLVPALTVLLSPLAIGIGLINGIMSAFAGLSAFIMPVVTGFAAMTSTVWIVAGAITALIAIGVLLYKNWGTVVSWLTSAWNAIKTTAVNVFTSIVDFFKKWGLDILVGLTGPIGILALLIYKNWDTIKTQTVAIWNSVVQFFVSVWTGIVTTAQTIWGGIVTFFSTIWTNIVTGVTAFLTMIGTFFSNAWNAISTTTSTIFNAIVTTLVGWGMKLYTALGIDVMVNTVVSIFNFLKTTLSLTFQMIIAVLGAIWNKLVQIIQPIAEAVVNFVISRWNNLKNNTITEFNMVKSFLSSVWNAIIKVIKAVVSPIVSWLSSKWNSIKSTVSSVFNSVKTKISSVWNSIKSAIQKVVSSIVSYLQGKWSTLKSNVSSAFNSVRSVASKVWNSIKSTVSSVANGIYSAVKNAFNKVKSVASSIFNGVKSAISSVWNSIKSKVTSVALSMYSVLKSRFNSIKSAVINPLSSAKTTLLGIISKIKNAFSSMHITIPKPKLPHISVSKGTKKFLGSTIPYPKFSVSWYETGGIFAGSKNGQIVGIAENGGDEAIIPLSKKRRMQPFANAIAGMISSNQPNNNNNGIINQFNISSMVVREEADIDKIATALEKKQRRQNRAKGLVS